MANAARFVELLFADQALDEVLASLADETMPEGVWRLLTRAAEHLRRGEAAHAAKVLLEIASDPNTATRILLWSWASLRRLEIHPRSHDADDIKGVVIQVPMENGIDVLAAYADGTVRYVNRSGKVIVWDIDDATIAGLTCKLLESSETLRGIAMPASSNHAVSDVVRVTVLTFNGNRFAEAFVQSLAASPINQVMGAGAELMASLIKRSESMNRVMAKAPRRFLVGSAFTTFD